MKPPNYTIKTTSVVIICAIVMAVFLAVAYLKITKQISLIREKKIELPQNEKLVDVVYKDGKLWYLTRPANSGEKPINYRLIEGTSGIYRVDYTISER